MPDLRADQSAMSEIAPRLARAHTAELEYQRRKADVRRRGVLAIDIATEEMIRSMRLMARHTAAVMRQWKLWRGMEVDMSRAEQRVRKMRPLKPEKKRSRRALLATLTRDYARRMKRGRQI